MWNSIIAMVVAKLIEQIFSKPGASDAVKAQLVAATTPDEVRAILKTEITSAVSDVVGGSIPADIITELATANSADAVQAVLDNPVHKDTILTAVGNMVGGLIGLIFPKK